MTGQINDKSRLETNETSGRWPDFILVGAMKSGTTTIYEYLSRHPKIYMSELKEPGFFSRDSIHARGEDWYRRLFQPARPDQICGEGSTCYTRCTEYPKAAERLHQALPHAKLIYSMRHPVDRAYSHYQHAMRVRYVKEGQDPVSLEEAIEIDPQIIDAGLYRMQIDHLLRYFPREQLLPVMFDELMHEPEILINRILKFLEQDPMSLPKEERVVANKTTSERAVKRRMDRSLYRLRSKPPLSWIAHVIPRQSRRSLRSWLSDQLIKTNKIHGVAGEFQIEPLSKTQRAALRERFAGPNRDLAQFLERDLSAWDV